MNGTEWTEPGRGATVADIWRRLLHDGQPDNIEYAKRARELRLKWTDERAAVRTNLRLTGAPLNEYDLRRIAEAK